MQETVSVVALIVSIIALAVSAILSFRQVRLMNKANQWPLMVNLIQELRSPAFMERERYVNSRLRKECDPALGQSGLKPDAAESMQVLASLFNSIGTLMAFDVIDARLAIASFGYRADRAWQSLEPFIIAERQRRRGDYMNYFEHFVAVTRVTPPERIRKSLQLREL